MEATVIESPENQFHMNGTPLAKECDFNINDVLSDQNMSHRLEMNSKVQSLNDYGL